ncbi:hypothetical protein B0H13DRAFT_1898522 [Mycena leptocephala]|nr:hypothetical protein B0H13DRAFT_1898522 [Mycena leptocephala]
MEILQRFGCRDKAGSGARSVLDGALKLLEIDQVQIKWSDAIDDPGDLMSSDKWAFHTFLSLDPNRRITMGQKGLENFLDTLHVDKISSLDELTFTDYLCCINSFLAPVNPRMLVEVNKSRLRLPLMVQLFKMLQRPNTDISLAAKIISTTAHLMNKSGASTRTWWKDIKDLMTEISQFCSTFPPGHESLQVLTNLEWVFSSLEYVQQLWEESPNAHQGTEEWDSTTTLSLRSLLQFLICSSLPLQPPLRSLHIILRALSAPGDPSLSAARVLYRAPRNWFLDPNLQPIMQESTVWPQLGRVTLKYLDPINLERYLNLGEAIAKIAEWKPIIYEDLSTWITAFMCTNGFISSQFISVIRSVWVPEFTDQMQLLNERNKSWVLALTALANVWNTFQFSSMHALACLHLARCTVSTSLRVQYFCREHDYTQKPIPSDIRAAFSSQLGEALIQAAANARSILVEPSPELLGGTRPEESPPFERIAELLDVLGKKLQTEFEPASGEVQFGGATKQYKDWKQLEEYFEAEFDTLEAFIILGIRCRKISQLPEIYDTDLLSCNLHPLITAHGGPTCGQGITDFLGKNKIGRRYVEGIYQIYISTKLSRQREPVQLEAGNRIIFACAFMYLEGFTGGLTYDTVNDFFSGPYLGKHRWQD